MSILYGAQPLETATNESNLNYDAIGKNSEAFTAYDPVTYSSGQLIVAGTTNSIAGVVVKTQTMGAANVGSTNTTPGYIPVDSTTEFLMGTNSDLTGNATDVGTYYKLTANTTATVQVDVANSAQTTTNRVVMIKKVDPFNLGGTGSGSGLRQCVVIFVRTPTWIDQ